MKKLLYIVISFFVIPVFLLSSCKTQNDDPLPVLIKSPIDDDAFTQNPTGSDIDQDDQPGEDDDDKIDRHVLFQQAITKNNLAITKTSLQSKDDEDYDKGYLAEDASGKSFVILQGSPYNMGYQMGSLMPEGVRRMTKEYVKNLAITLLGVSYDIAPDLYDYFIEEAKIYCRETIDRGVIPDYLIEEMQGVADGASDAGQDVSFDDVLLLNQASDCLYTFLYTGNIPGIEDLEAMLRYNPYLIDNIQVADGKVIFPKAGEMKFGCNEFVVSGNATADGGTFHGRDFQYSNGGVYHDEVCMGVYIPDDGYPFICVTAPGWVGQATVLNSRGLSMGVDTVAGNCVRVSDPGIGCLLVVRDVIQSSANLDEAVEKTKSLDRSVPWIYVLADDTKSKDYTNGVVLETGRSDPDFNGYDDYDILERFLLSGAIPYIPLAVNYIGKLKEEPMPDKGVMAREMDWEFPEKFEGINISIDWGSIHLGVYFQEQIEDKPDVLIATNNFIIPRMRFTSFSFEMIFMDYVNGGSYHRYEKLVEIIEKEYGEIDFNLARDIIDYLNPNSQYREIVDRDYYEPGREVKGHHAVIDNDNLIMKSLSGYFSSDPEHKAPWASVDLKPFLEALETK